jgi:hypothetical protein
MNELVQIHPERPLDAYRMSTDAAGACREIVVATASTIQGRKFVSVEGWQAIAIAHGCVAGSRDVERVDGGVRAVGEVRRMSDGQLIATAEGFVGEDETTWYGGKDKRGKVHDKRNDYAIRAMAQTRAISRACRSAFAHVVVMMKAGLQTTPAEEVPSEGFDRTPHNPETGEVIEGEVIDAKIPGITKIRNNLNKLRRDGGKATTLEQFNALVHANADDLQKIKDASHTLWTGMGEDFDGFRAWIKARREELTPVPESTAYQLLTSLVKECKTGGDLTALLDEYADTIGELDGDEGRRFETFYNAHEEALRKPTPMTAEAFGG